MAMLNNQMVSGIILRILRFFGFIPSETSARRKIPRRKFFWLVQYNESSPIYGISSDNLIFINHENIIMFIHSYWINHDLS